MKIASRGEDRGRMRRGRSRPAWRRSRLACVAALLGGWAAAACSGTVVVPDPGEAELAEGLVGSWTWLRSTGGIAGVVLTPESRGHTGLLRFRPDGTVEWREDGEPVWTTTWRLSRGAEGSPLAGEQIVLYGEPVVGWDRQAVRLDGSRLMLIDPCCDGFVHEYTREGP